MSGKSSQHWREGDHHFPSPSSCARAQPSVARVWEWPTPLVQREEDLQDCLCSYVRFEENMKIARWVRVYVCVCVAALLVKESIIYVQVSIVGTYIGREECDGIGYPYCTYLGIPLGIVGTGRDLPFYPERAPMPTNHMGNTMRS